MGGTASPVLTASRILNSDRSNAGSNDDEDITDWVKSSEFIVAIQLDEQKGPWTTTYKLKWRNVTDSGSFADLAASGAELIQGTDTALTNGTNLTSGNARCVNDPGGSWKDGEEVEGANTTDSLTLADEEYTELQFAVDPSGAHDSDQYEFQLVDAGNGDAEIGVVLAQITMEAGAAVWDEEVNEIASLADPKVGNAYMAGQVNEIMSTKDARGVRLIFNASLSEGVSTGESMGPRAIYNLPFSEMTSIIDTVLGQAKYALSVEDIISLSDTVNGSIIVHDTVYEYVSFYDALLAALLYSLRVNEITTLADAVSAGAEAGDVFDESLTEGMSLADTVTALVMLYLDLRGTISLADFVTGEVAAGGGIYNEAILERLSMKTETIAMFLHVLTLADKFSVQEEAQSKVIFNLAVTEKASISDVMLGIFRFAASVTENFSTGEIIIGTSVRPSIEVRKGKAYIFTIDTVKPKTEIKPKPGAIDITKYH